LAHKVKSLGTNLDRAAIAKIENGLRAVLDYELQLLATSLGVSIRHLVSAPSGGGSSGGV